MTKSEKRKARKQARENGEKFTGELVLDKKTDLQEFSETARGYRAREKWARFYDSLNGAPEGPSDY